MIPISWRNLCSHNISCAASDKIMYLALVEDSVTIDYCFDDQDTTPFPKKMAYPPVDVLSLVLPTKSASA